MPLRPCRYTSRPCPTRSARSEQSASATKNTSPSATMTPTNPCSSAKAEKIKSFCGHRQEAPLGLGTLGNAAPPERAGANRDFRLDHLIARSLRILARIEETYHPLPADNPSTPTNTQPARPPQQSPGPPPHTANENPPKTLRWRGSEETSTPYRDPAESSPGSSATPTRPPSLSRSRSSNWSLFSSDRYRATKRTITSLTNSET